MVMRLRIVQRWNPYAQRPFCIIERRRWFMWLAVCSASSQSHAEHLMHLIRTRQLFLP